MKDIYRVHFPNSYQVFLNYLYSSKICEFINNYISEYPKESNTSCETFFFGCPRFNFFDILAMFIEEIRKIRDKIDYYYEIAEKKNYTYNESYFNDPKGLYEEMYKKHENNIDEYKKYNPANILQTDSHKKLLITYLYINTQVYSFLISESLKQFEQVFAKYNSINLLLNIIFIIFVVLVFIILWIPLILYKIKTFEKLKSMLYIIPNDLLINIPDINNLIGIDEQ